MTLSGQQIGTLTEIVIEAFSRADLTILVRVKLEIVLDNEVPTDNGWKAVVFAFIDRQNQQGLADELLRVLREARPKHAGLITFSDQLNAQTNGSPPTTSAGSLSKAIRAFNEGFDDRNTLFQYLNAYKELHDVLHELQSFQPEVAAAVDRRKADPSQPLPDDVAFFLDEHLQQAERSAQEIEFPENPPKWIARFAAAVEAIRGSDVDRMARHVERLRTLPGDSLSALNEKLFENASRLKPDQLIGSLDDIITALGTDGSAAKQKLRGDVGGFRSLCKELDDLIQAHNLCQRIDDALHDAAGLPSVTTNELAEWDVARRSLKELAEQRKGDMRIKRTTDAADLFEAANQAQAFRTLIERFNDLFMETDKALLRVTNRMPRMAMSLHSALEKLL